MSYPFISLWHLAPAYLLDSTFYFRCHCHSPSSSRYFFICACTSASSASILLYLINVHQRFFLKGIHIPGDIQIEVVLLDLVEGGYIAVLVLVLPRFIGVDNAGNIAVPQDILVFALLKISPEASINNTSRRVRFFLNTSIQAGMPVP